MKKTKTNIVSLPNSIITKFSLYALYDYISIDTLSEITQIDKNKLKDEINTVNLTDTLIMHKNGDNDFIKLSKGQLSKREIEKHQDIIVSVDKKIIDIYSDSHKAGVSDGLMHYVRYNCYHHLLNHRGVEYFEENLLKLFNNDINLFYESVYPNILNIVQKVSETIYKSYLNKEITFLQAKSRIVQVNKKKQKILKDLLSEYYDNGILEHYQLVAEYIPVQKAIYSLYNVLINYINNFPESPLINDINKEIESRIGMLNDYTLKALYKSIFNEFFEIKNADANNNDQKSNDLIDIEENKQQMIDYFQTNRDIKSGIFHENEVSEALSYFDCLEGTFDNISIQQNCNIIDINQIKLLPFTELDNIESILETTMKSIIKLIYNDMTSEEDEIDKSNVDKSINELLYSFGKNSNQSIDNLSNSEWSEIAYNTFLMYKNNEYCDYFGHSYTNSDIFFHDICSLYEDVVYDVLFVSIYVDKVTFQQITNCKYITDDLMFAAVSLLTKYNKLDFDDIYQYIHANLYNNQYEKDPYHYQKLLGLYFASVTSHNKIEVENLDIYKNKALKLLDCDEIKSTIKYSCLKLFVKSNQFSIYEMVDLIREFYSGIHNICGCSICNYSKAYFSNNIEEIYEEISKIILVVHCHSMRDYLLDLSTIPDYHIEQKESKFRKLNPEYKIQSIDESCINYFENIIDEIAKTPGPKKEIILKDGKQKYLVVSRSWINEFNSKVISYNLQDKEMISSFYYYLGRLNLFEFEYIIKTIAKPNNYKDCINQYIIGNIDYAIENSNNDLYLNAKVLTQSAIIVILDLFINKDIWERLCMAAESLDLSHIANYLIENIENDNYCMNNRFIYTILNSNYIDNYTLEKIPVKQVLDYLVKSLNVIPSFIKDVFSNLMSIYAAKSDDISETVRRYMISYNNNFLGTNVIKSTYYDYFNSIEASAIKLLINDKMNFNDLVALGIWTYNYFIIPRDFKKMIIYYALENYEFMEVQDKIISLEYLENKNFDNSFTDNLILRNIEKLNNRNISYIKKQHSLEKNCLSVLSYHSCGEKLLDECIKILESGANE